MSKFKFTADERSLILLLPGALKHLNELNDTTENMISQNAKKVGHWFDECPQARVESKISNIDMPNGAENLLCRMLEAAKINSTRKKQGYRYKRALKRLAVYNRLLSGPLGYKSIQLNLKGCFPSISATNKYIHRSDHRVVEGVLRCQELLTYLKERNLPLWVSLSEDATRVENRIQYDGRTFQVIGLVLPTNESNGMPIPFSYKGRNATEILQYFSRRIPVAHFVNTIIAQPLADAPSFCILIFGSDNKYKAMTVAKRWEYISKELVAVGIGVLNISSDSDPKYNSAMRMNSGIGDDSEQYSMNDMFRCGTKIRLPFYTQDYPHIGTKLRNLILQTIANLLKLPMGEFFIQLEHLNQLMKMCKKDQHLLTATTLNPNDRQNFESVLKM